jgi:predicted O-methyltransferase YrrM
MSGTTLNLTESLRNYMLSVSLREHPLLESLRKETASHPFARYQIAPEQGQFMALLVQLIQARRVIEVGVFTGYSSLATALALPDDGRIVACDIDEDATTTAKRYWEEAGVAHKIDLKLAPALKTLDGLAKEGGRAYDFAFIDADKENYDHYYERLLTLIRPGGLIAVDNVLWNGRVIDDANTEPATIALRRFNEKLHHDDRINLSLVPIADGLTLARKR